MRIIVARLLQQVSSGGKARTSRTAATAVGSNQQLPCSPAGSYSLLPSAGARIPVSIAFREDQLSDCPVRLWAGVQDTVGVCLGPGDNIKSSCVCICWKGERSSSANLSSRLPLLLRSQCSKGLSCCALVVALTAANSSNSSSRSKQQQPLCALGTLLYMSRAWGSNP